MFRLMKTKENRRRGAASVELAVTAPLLVLLILGMIEAGRGMMVQQILGDLAREGARKAAVKSMTDTEIETYVEGLAADLSLPAVDAQCSVDPSTASSGDAITVTAKVTYNDISWLPKNRFFSDITLQSATVMSKDGVD